MVIHWECIRIKLYGLDYLRDALVYDNICILSYDLLELRIRLEVLQTLLTFNHDDRISVV